MISYKKTIKKMFYRQANQRVAPPSKMLRYKNLFNQIMAVEYVNYIVKGFEN